MSKLLINPTLDDAITFLKARKQRDFFATRNRIEKGKATNEQLNWQEACYKEVENILYQERRRQDEYKNSRNEGGADQR